MKIGILTFHHTMNYGAVLQAFALQTFLQRHGYDVQILDKWLIAEDLNLYIGNDHLSLSDKIKNLIGRFLGIGVKPLLLIRGNKTRKFYKNFLCLTDYHFYTWSDCPKNKLTFDCFVVGSDQVFRNWNDKRLGFFLLENAPSIPAISYAASFGMKNIPDLLLSRYRSGLKKFKALSVREKTGEEIIRDLGMSSTHVCDPTLLLTKSDWNSFFHFSEKEQNSRKHLFCYFMHPDFENYYDELLRFSHNQNYTVDVFFNWQSCPGISFPKSFNGIKKWWNGQKIFRATNGVIFHRNAGPEEFIQCISQADASVCDSFHGLMFSIIYGLNVRSLRPKDSESGLKNSFSRIEEFADYTISGKLIADDLQSALKSIAEAEPVVFDQDKIQEKRRFSQEWLCCELEKINSKL